MKDCCKSTKKDKQCVRKSDGKIFTLPRRFSKNKCKKGVKGFTMRSSCAPYKDCLTMRKKMKKKKKGGNPKTYKKNINMQKALFQIFNETNKFVAVTMGSKGVYWVENNSLYHCNVPKVKTVETNCAGDVFHGAFATALSLNKSNSQSIQLAAATATLKCMKAGGIYSIPNLNNVKKFLKKLKIRKIK